MKGIQKNYYQILGVNREASLEEIERRFEEIYWENEVLRKMDPWFPIEETILEQSRAFITLRDKNLREEYDKKIDFDIVILDKEIEKTDLADISHDFKKYCAYHYDDLVRKFHYFKKEMSVSLWLIKTTSIFFIFSVIISSILTYYSFYWIKDYSESLYKQFKNWGFTYFIVLVTTQYLFFRLLWQNPKKKSITTEKES